jgi:hypothetical protein
MIHLLGVACHGGSDEPLNIHLKRIVDSAYTRKTLGGADIDGELIAPVIQESHDGECRRLIMRYLRECLSEANGKRWQKIYGGLALTEKLMQHGSPALAIEVAHGHHFDLVQKVSFLEHFDAAARGCTDRRAQSMVRTKATELLALLVPLLERASAEELPQNAGLNGKDNCSLCSKDTASRSTSTGSTAASSNVDNVSPPSSVPTSPALETPKKQSRIDDSFADLQMWMESADYSSGASAPVTPRSASDADDSDWEPIGSLPVQAKPSGDRSPWGNKSECSDAADTFFTPMPAPAAPAVSRPAKLVMSL